MASYYYEFHRGYRIGIDCTVISQSIADRTSTVEVSAFLQSTASSCTISSSASKTVTLYVDGQAYKHSGSGLARLSGNQKKTLCTERLTIQHDERGAHTLSLYCAFDIDVTLGSTHYGSVRCPSSGSNLMELPAIVHAPPALAVTATQTNPASIDAYITNQSTVTLRIRATVEDGAQIAACDIAFGSDGAAGSFRHSVRDPGTDYSYMFLLPEIDGDSVEIAVAATDSYGYASTPHRLTLEGVLHYAPPEITDIRWARGRMELIEEGPEERFVEDVNGDRIRITALGRVSSLDGQNAKDSRAEYRVKGAPAFGELLPAAPLDGYEFTVERVTDAVFSADAAYDVRFIVSDSFMRVVEVLSVASRTVLLNFSPNGDAICAGGMATYPNTFQSWLTLLPSGGIAATQILEGQDLDEVTAPGWYYGEDGEGKFGLCVEQIGANARYQRLRRYDGKKLITRERCAVNQLWSAWASTETTFDI